MKRLFLSILTGIAAAAIASPARANIILSLEPSSQAIGLGGSASMDLVISGLGDHASPSLGAFSFFNFDLSYNSAVLSAVSVTFGNHLDLGIAGSIQHSDLTTPGAIRIDEVSLESEAALNAAQPASFTLATLNFTGVGVGLGTVSITGGSLSDETGLISLPFTSGNGQIQVGGSTHVTDVGSTGLLLLFGIASLSALRKCRQTAMW